MDHGTVTGGPHEGEWIYLSTPLAHLNGSAGRLTDGITATIRARGWLALTAGPADDRRSTAARLHALRTADACVFDVSTPSADIGAEVASAIHAGRPVIALQYADRPPSNLVRGMLEADGRARTIVYRDVEDCLTALHEALEDPNWIASVGDAAGHDTA
jgi:DNA-binding NarL/FixJ family response regulator